MKKVFLFAMIAMIGATASAADMTKAEFIAKRKALAEKAGKEFNLKSTEATFERRDLNKDGVLSPDELAPAKPKTTE